MLVPVVAGQPFSINLMLYTPNASPTSPSCSFPTFNFIAFGSGTISVASNSPALAEARKRAHARVTRQNAATPALQ